jgi:hypothetical protein
MKFHKIWIQQEAVIMIPFFPSKKELGKAQERRQEQLRQIFCTIANRSKFWTPLGWGKPTPNTHLYRQANSQTPNPIASQHEEAETNLKHQRRFQNRWRNDERSCVYVAKKG